MGPTIYLPGTHKAKLHEKFYGGHQVGDERSGVHNAPVAEDFLPTRKVLLSPLGRWRRSLAPGAGACAGRWRRR